MYTPYVGPVGVEVTIGGFELVWGLVCDGVFVTAAAEVVDVVDVVGEGSSVTVIGISVTRPFLVVVADLMHMMWDLTVQHVWGAEDAVDSEGRFEVDEVAVFLGLVENFVSNIELEALVFVDKSEERLAESMVAGMEDDEALLFLGIVVIPVDRNCADEDTAVLSRLEEAPL